MSRRAAFTQTEVERAIRAFRKQGRTVTGFEKTAHGFRLLTEGGGADLSSDQQAEDEWDKALGLR